MTEKEKIQLWEEFYSEFTRFYEHSRQWTRWDDNLECNMAYSPDDILEFIVEQIELIMGQREE